MPVHFDIILVLPNSALNSSPSHPAAPLRTNLLSIVNLTLITIMPASTDAYDYHRTSLQSTFAIKILFRQHYTVSTFYRHVHTQVKYRRQTSFLLISIQFCFVINCESIKLAQRESRFAEALMHRRSIECAFPHLYAKA